MSSRKRVIYIILGIVVVFIVLIFGYRIAWAGRVFPGVSVGSLYVGGLPREMAYEKILSRINILNEQGIRFSIDGQAELARPIAFGFTLDAKEASNRAMLAGREGNYIKRVWNSLLSPLKKKQVSVPLDVDEVMLTQGIDNLATLYDSPVEDIRLVIEGTEVSVSYDTRPGRILDKRNVRQSLSYAFKNLEVEPIRYEFIEVAPTINSKTAEEAKSGAINMMSDKLTLGYKGRTYVVTAEDIGDWIISENNNGELRAAVNVRAVSAYVVDLAEKINSAPQSPKLVVENGKVIEFTPPVTGLVLEENETIAMIVDALESRRDARETVTGLSLPVVAKAPIVQGSAAELGIVELIGKATTSFAGSPANRRHNIENGTRFLTGILISPGEEFSTIGSLGRIDNTTGYLPELVIKGDRTIPEFGGGLCQVSTTLFRAILDAGLPITARRNHSYRVSYYEKDGDGNYIGPGLDATIYSPNPDLRFLNDTASTILISGYVVGDFVTFELYGKRDGRVAEVDGPYTLTTIPPGEPIIVATDELEPGEKKRLERAHDGGSAAATYKVTYPDGRVEEEEFRSYYRPWPERWIVGIDPLNIDNNKETAIETNKPITDNVTEVVGE